MHNLSELYKLIRRFEGCRLRAYLCPAGVWTVGWGATGPEIGPTTFWTQAQADARLERDAQNFAKQTLLLSPSLHKNHQALAALADFCYNLGTGAYRGSTLRRRVNEESWPAARDQLLRWVRGGGRVLRGLVLRRQAEAELLPES